MARIELNGQVFEYEVLRKKIKNIYIRYRDEHFVVTAPKRATETEIIALFKKNEASLLKYIKRIDERKKFSYEEGQVKAILGEEYRLCYGTKTCLVNHDLYLNRANPRKALLNFVKAPLLTYLEKRVSYWHLKMYGDQNIPTLRVKSVRSYFGQYDWKKQVISFNSILAFAPFELIDYVIVHELCHLRYRDHQKEFKALLYKFMPDYKIRKARLKKEVAVL